MAISGLFGTQLIMSALPPKADIFEEVAKSLLLTPSGLWFPVKKEPFSN